jgi:hypothetical protein
LHSKFLTHDGGYAGRRVNEAHVPAYYGRKGVNDMRPRHFVIFLAVALFFAIGVADAGAVTVPSIPVSDYGSALLSGLATAVTQVFPYAAAITAFAIGVGLVRRWLGAKKATKV